MKKTKRGDIISTQHGKGEIKSINHTYSIPLYLVDLTEGKFRGDSLALTEMEFEVVKE
jgi:hypothetical protein